MNNSDFTRVDALLLSMEREHGRLKEEITRCKTDLERAKRDKLEWNQLREIVVETANRVQLDVAERISSIVSLALSATGFDYSFKVSFVLRRGSTEADLFFVKNGEELNPLSCSGGVHWKLLPLLCV